MCVELTTLTGRFLKKRKGKRNHTGLYLSFSILLHPHAPPPSWTSKQVEMIWLLLPPDNLSLFNVGTEARPAAPVNMLDKDWEI